MLRVERGARDKRIRRNHRGALLTRHIRHYPSPGINRRRQSRIRRAQQPAIVFDGPHPSLLQVLLPCPAISIPAVIRDIHQHPGPIERKPSHFVGKNRLITDKGPDSFSASIQRLARCAMLKLPNLFRQPASESKYLRKRQILSKRHEVNFVIPPRPFPLRTHQRRRIENQRTLPPALVRWRHSDRSHDHPVARLPSQFAHRIAKPHVISEERSRGLWPDNHFFSRSCASFRVCDWRLQAQTSQILQCALKVILCPIRLNRNIRLHQNRCPICGRRRWLHRPLSHLKHKRRPKRRPEQPIPPAFLHQKRRRKNAIHQHNLKRDSIHARQSCDSTHRDIRSLRVSQQLPRKRRNPRPRQLDCDPNKWRRHQRAHQ